MRPSPRRELPSGTRTSASLPIPLCSRCSAAQGGPWSGRRATNPVTGLRHFSRRRLPVRQGRQTWSPTRTRAGRGAFPRTAPASRSLMQRSRCSGSTPRTALRWSSSSPVRRRSKRCASWEPTRSSSLRAGRCRYSRSPTRRSLGRRRLGAPPGCRVTTPAPAYNRMWAQSRPGRARGGAGGAADCVARFWSDGFHACGFSASAPPMSVPVAASLTAPVGSHGPRSQPRWCDRVVRVLSFTGAP